MEHEAQAAAEQAQPDPQALAVLPPPERAAVALQSSATEQHLRGLIERTAAITNVVDKNGREEAHSAAMMLKNARVDVVKAGKAAREDAVAFQKAVVAESDRLAAITAAEEARLFGLRDAFDEKVAAEKAEKERIEAERKAAIRARIDAILCLPAKYAGMGSDDLTQLLAELARRDVAAEGFDEFTDEARTTIDTVADALLAMRDKAAEREEAARAERMRQELAQREAEEAARELARQNAELAERLRVEEEEKTRREVAEQLARAAAAKREQDLREEMEAIRAQLAAAQAAANPAPAPDPEPVITPAIIMAAAETLEANRLAVVEHAAGIDWDELAPTVMAELILEPSPVETPRIDDSQAVAALLGAVRELYASRSPEEICELVSDQLDELEAGEGK